MIGRDGFACLGRVTLADCALVPALFFLENVLPGTGARRPDRRERQRGRLLGRDPERRVRGAHPGGAAPGAGGTPRTDPLRRDREDKGGEPDAAREAAEQT